MRVKKSEEQRCCCWSWEREKGSRESRSTQCSEERDVIKREVLAALLNNGLAKSLKFQPLNRTTFASVVTAQRRKQATHFSLAVTNLTSFTRLETFDYPSMNILPAS